MDDFQFVLPNLPPAISTWATSMERYEQQNRRGFRKDDTFSSTTIKNSHQQSRSQPQTKSGHSDVERRSRVDELSTSSTFFSDSRTQKHVKNASNSESEDELRIAPRPRSSQPKQPAKLPKESADATQTDSQKIKKSKSQSLIQKPSEDVPSSRPKRTPAAFPMDLDSFKSSPPERKDEAREFLTNFLSEKQEPVQANNQKNNKTDVSKFTPKPTMNTKPVNGSKKPSKPAKTVILDDEKVQSSDEEVKTEAKSRKGFRKLKPKPFPMDLSSLPSSSGTLVSNSSLPVRNRKSSSLSSSSTASLERPSTKSLHSSDSMDYSSDS